MNKRIRITLLLVTVIVFSSCGQENVNEKIVSEWLGKQVDLPQVDFLKNKTSVNPVDKKIKILTLIDGDCSVCVEELKAWEVFMSKVDTTKVGFIFVIYSFDNLNGFNDLNNSTIHFKYPYFTDLGKKYIYKNNFSKEKVYQTMLLDESNKVITIGSPIMYKTMEKFYLAKINKELKKSVKQNSKLRVNKRSLNIDKLTFKDEKGTVLTFKKVGELMKTKKYIQTIDHKSKIITLIKKKD
jgi:hypothetical protein